MQPTSYGVTGYFIAQTGYDKPNKAQALCLKAFIAESTSSAPDQVPALVQAAQHLKGHFQS